MNKEKDNWISMTNDLVFKHVFSHQEPMQDLLDSVFVAIGLESEKITRIMGQRLLSGKNIKNKKFFGDIIVELESEKSVSVEMYNDFGKEQYNKSLSYLTRLYSGQIKPRGRYINNKPMYSINFMYGDYHGDNPKLINKYGLVSGEKLFETIDKELFMWLFRLDKVKTDGYNTSRLEKWMMLMNAKTKEEAQRIGEGDKMFEQAIDYVDEFVNDPLLKQAYEEAEREKLWYEDKGLAKGEKKRNNEIAKNMIASGEPLSKISKYTGLPIKDIKALKK